MVFVNTLKIKLPDPAISFLSSYSEDMQSVGRKDICTPMLTAELFTIPKIWNQPKWPSADKW
jgi:hypothetical protein